MPYPTEHSCRVRDPKDFEANSFRRKKIRDGVNIILGRLKGETTMTTQAYRFDKNIFTAAEAQAWLKKNKVKCIEWEPAKSKCEDFLKMIKI